MEQYTPQGTVPTEPFGQQDTLVCLLYQNRSYNKNDIESKNPVCHAGSQ